MTAPAEYARLYAKIQLDIIALQKKLVDMNERLTFYEERVAQNRVLIEENRADIDRLDDERSD
jgi:hypothetical protein